LTLPEKQGLSNTIYSYTVTEGSSVMMSSPSPTNGVQDLHVHENLL